MENIIVLWLTSFKIKKTFNGFYLVKIIRMGRDYTLVMREREKPWDESQQKWFSWDFGNKRKQIDQSLLLVINDVVE
jgi:hypothetical protein